ncbi:ATP-grasp domain-containing protein [Oceanobacillus massiliensis]|uniref:ATP-grasp domain-containing protein n=1 Tax=Oceanobacillus massiliensis TaxID=1465765 RepID=UPI000287EBA1|nr:RimK family alpha-L-glutamate ligase [Oceanobacillus massiliensis]
MNKKGWVIYNGNLAGNKFLDYAEMIQAAASAKNLEITIMKNNELLSLLSKDILEIVSFAERELPDFAVFADKDIYLAKQLELVGVKVFNSAEAIEISDDKIATYQHLAVSRLPIPRTIIAPKVFYSGQLEETLLDKVIREIRLPMIIKEAYGSFGEQVYLLHSKEAIHKKMEEIQGKAYLFQEFVPESYGRDLRLQVVGSKVVAAMERNNRNDFRANVTAGGSMSSYTPSQSESDLAVAAASAIKADFAGVDLLIGPDNTRIVCEVNSNAHIRNLLECTGVNAADYIIDYILEALS